MAAIVYRYIFSESLAFDEVEASFLLAIFAAESLHGEALVRLEAAHAMDRLKRACVIDATTTVGQDLNRLFVGFLNREFGPDAFRIERITEPISRTAMAVA